MTDQEHLRQWLIDHPFISVSAVSKAIGWDRRTLGEILSGHRAWRLDEEELTKIEAVLKKYGYPEK